MPLVFQAFEFKNILCKSQCVNLKAELNRKGSKGDAKGTEEIYFSTFLSIFDFLAATASMFPETLTYYLTRFKKLRLDRSHGGPAPHKPILLISLLQAYRSGLIRSREVNMIPELVAPFKENWSLLVTATNFDCKISYPFYHLKSDKFWKLHPRAGFDNLDTMGSLIKSPPNFHAAVKFTEMDKFNYRIGTERNLGNDISCEKMYYCDNKKYTIRITEIYELKYTITATRY